MRVTCPMEGQREVKVTADVLHSAPFGESSSSERTTAEDAAAATAEGAAAAAAAGEPAAATAEGAAAAIAEEAGGGRVRIRECSLSQNHASRQKREEEDTTAKAAASLVEDARRKASTTTQAAKTAPPCAEIGAGKADVTIAPSAKEGSDKGLVEKNHTEKEEDWSVTPEYLQHLKEKYADVEHPLFMDELPRDITAHPHLHALQQLVYDGETPATAAERMRVAGNAWLQGTLPTVSRSGRKKQQQALRNAIDCYTHGLDQQCEDKKLNSVLLCNRAHCYLLLDDYIRCREDCRRAIALNPHNIKAYYRAGRASLQLELFNEATDFTSRGLRIDPHNTALVALNVKAQEKQQELAKRRERNQQNQQQQQQQEEEEEMQQKQQQKQSVPSAADVLKSRGIEVVALQYSLVSCLEKNCARVEIDENGEKEGALPYVTRIGGRAEEATSATSPCTGEEGGVAAAAIGVVGEGGRLRRAAAAAATSPCSREERGGAEAATSATSSPCNEGGGAEAVGVRDGGGSLRRGERGEGEENSIHRARFAATERKEAVVVVEHVDNCTPTATTTTSTDWSGEESTDDQRNGSRRRETAVAQNNTDSVVVSPEERRLRGHLYCVFTVLLLFDEPGITETITDFDERYSFRFYLSHMFPCSSSACKTTHKKDSHHQSHNNNTTATTSVPFVAWDTDHKYLVDRMCLFYEVENSAALKHFVEHHDIREL